MGHERQNPTPAPKRVPAWLLSVVFHAGAIAAVAVLMPVVFYHQASFGPPLQVVQRVEPEERLLPRWRSDAEMPTAPALEILLEPVEEPEAEDERKPVEGDSSAARTVEASPACAYPVYAVGLRTRPRALLPNAARVPASPVVATNVPAVAPALPSVPVARQTGGPSRAARVLGELDPRYPERQRLAGRSATVLLLVCIDETGRPTDMELLNKDIHPDFVKAAMAAARKALYEPAVAEGRPVASALRLRIQFQLQ